VTASLALARYRVTFEATDALKVTAVKTLVIDVLE